MEDRQYGMFEDDGQAFLVTDRQTPRHWYNYFYNDTYNAFASQVGYGEGIAQDNLGRRALLVSDRCVYIVDKENGAWHTGVGLPMSETFDAYSCRHALGRSTITCEKNGIETKFTLFVPKEGMGENWIIEVTNKRAVPADLTVIGYCGTETDGIYRPQGYNSQASYYHDSLRAIAARVTSGLLDGQHKVLCGYMASDGEVVAYDTRRTAFIGTYGTKDAPQALTGGTPGCTNSDCVVEKQCYALENACPLAPGERKIICLRVGITLDTDTLAQECADYLAPGAPQRALDEISAWCTRQVSGVRIQTPDKTLNQAFNHFYKYATAMGSRWARVRHNGYRDLMSDTECLGSFNPRLAWDRYKYALGYQYSNGYAPRTFLDGRVQDNNYADCAVWITFTGYALVHELGDLKLLDEQVPFNDGTAASVYEHMRRSVEFLYNFKGANGMIKIWGGDWNDSMCFAGMQGRGESVWLSIAWYRACKMLVELEETLGLTETAQAHREMGENMRELIERFGWDGKYYITAINDWGEKIGSQECAEGKMYLNPQLWAVFSGLADREKLLSIFDQVDAVLDCPLGTRVNYPPYIKPEPRIGTLATQPPDTLINGAVYLHPMAWKLAAECLLRRPHKLQQTLEQILPWNRKWAPTVGEPYVLYNFYYGEKTGYRYGTPGQSWRTATTAWVVKSIINFIFGLKPGLDGLKLDPCLPPDWRECKIEKDFRGCRYHIRFRQSAQSNGTVRRVMVDGKDFTGQYLPYRQDECIQVDVEII